MAVVSDRRQQWQSNRNGHSIAGLSFWFVVAPTEVVSEARSIQPKGGVLMDKRALWRVGLSVFAIALVAFALAAPASAQEQVGSIAGKVLDSANEALPGATVEATQAGGAKLTAITGPNGEFRFPRVPPGRYTVSAKLEGLSPAEPQNVVVTLGQAATLSFTLGVGVVSETISVVGEAGQIDVKGSSTSASITSEDIEMLPKGRDFTSVATLAAGVSQEGFAGGLSIDGASGSENRFVIDGVDTTDGFDGTSGQNLITDFVEEVQVKSAGYAAEFGGSVGGVINAVTKSGSNDFKGFVGLYYGDRGWDGKERKTVRNTCPAAPAGSPPNCSDSQLYVSYPEEDITRTEPNFGIGGPIVKDKAWFYVGYDHLETETTRTPLGWSRSYTQSDTREYYLINLKGNVGSQFLYKLSGNFAPRKLDNILPARDGSTFARDKSAFNIDDKFPTSSYSFYADWIPSNSFYLSGRIGSYDTDQKTSGTFPSGQILFRNRAYPADPTNFPAGWLNVPSVTGAITDEYKREAASLDSNFFFEAAGSHAIKGGVQYEKLKNTADTGEQVNLYTFRWGLPDRFGAGVQGTQGSLGVRRFYSLGAAASKNLGIYLQDSWSVMPNLTLNIGIRSEKEEVPNYSAAVNGAKNAWEFGFGDKIAPRLGFAWDVFSDQKLKVYGSWGYYYDISKLNIRGSFGGDQWIEYLWPVNTLDWQGLLASGNCTNSINDANVNPCPGLGAPAATLDLRYPADPNDPLFGVDPDLKPFQQEEYQIGADYQLTKTSVVGFRYVNKNVLHAIEDMGFFYCFSPTNCIEGYNIGNPGEGVGGQDPEGVVPAQPKAKREYQAIELSWNRRFANNWSAHVAYTYSELKGNYPGLASSDEFGRTSPNTNRLFDYVHNSYDRFGKAVYGKLNTDRPHQVDAQFIYQFGWGTSVGLNQYYGSGTPISTQVNYAGVPFFAFGRGDKGRTDALTQTDLMVSHPFKFGDYTVELSLNVLNLFDEDTAVLIDPNLTNGDLCTAYASAGCDRSQDWFFGHTPLSTGGLNPTQNNPYYLKPGVAGSATTADVFQTRRTIRAGLKFTF